MRLITIDSKEEYRSTMTLEEMQEFVGGYIEVVPIKNGQVVVCNEDGLSQKLSANSFGGFVGNIIVCTRKEVDGCA